MTRELNWLLPAILILIVAFTYGFVAGRFRVFPHKLLQQLVHRKRTSQSQPWSIGIYSGQTPFRLHSPKNVRNPVLTAQSVTDCEAAFVADPFMLLDNSRYYLFFEALTTKERKGVIGLADSDDGCEWKYRQVVLDEPFHLSYPYVFKHENEIYMIPESSWDFSVRLYRAIEFPCRWEFEHELLKGYRFADPSVIQYQGTWWMFVSTAGSDVLNLYYADELKGPWHQHPRSPLLKLNKHIARPGGRLIELDGNLYRFAQDDEPLYGLQVLAFQVTEITKSSYQERQISQFEMDKATKNGWNAHGMHTVDPHLVNGEWLVAIDGW